MADDRRMETDETIEELLGLVVHSYNNFLSGAIGFTELVKLETDNPEISEKLDLSIQSGREAVDFGNQLLCAVGRLQVSFEPIDLQKVLTPWTESQNTIHAEINLPSAALINSNATWLIRSLDIIVEFCRAYSPESDITVRLDQIAEASRDTETAAVQHLVINIRPELIQFEADQTRQLFKPFYSSRRLLGTKDVGLAVAAGFAEQMRGRLEWSNEKGFRLAIPLCSA